MYDLQFLQHDMSVIPVPFAKEHKTILAHREGLVENQNETWRFILGTTN
jgi:hypothetical protein